MVTSRTWLSQLADDIPENGSKVWSPKSASSPIYSVFQFFLKNYFWGQGEITTWSVLNCHRDIAGLYNELCGLGNSLWEKYHRVPIKRFLQVFGNFWKSLIDQSGKNSLNNFSTFIIFFFHILQTHLNPSFYFLPCSAKELPFSSKANLATCALKPVSYCFLRDSSPSIIPCLLHLISYLFPLSM